LTIYLEVRRVTNIIVAFSRQEDARSIKNILMRNGFQVVAVCTSGAQVLNSIEDLNGGIIVSGYRFEDMLYRGICDCMPAGFEMLLVASSGRLGGVIVQDIRCLSMPLKVHELVETVNTMCRDQVQRKRRMRQRPAERSEEDSRIILKAKTLLMERNSMTEMQAHRYIQKCSMDNGTNLVETARMVISLIDI
jgi:response regulator NasT